MQQTKEDRFFLRFILGMMALIALILALGGAAQCQVDIQIPRPNSDYVAVRNLVLGASGTGGFNNNFVFPALYSQESICLSIFNGSTSGESIQVTISATNDPSVSAFTGNTSRWITAIAMEGTNDTLGNVTVNAGSWAQFYAQTSGAARISIILTGSVAATGGADIVISQSQTSTASVSPGAIVAAGTNPSVNVSGSVTSNSNGVTQDSDTPNRINIMRCNNGTTTLPCFYGVAAMLMNNTSNVMERPRSANSGLSTSTGLAATVGYLAQFSTGAGVTVHRPMYLNALSMPASPGAFTVADGVQMADKGPRWTQVSQPASASQASAVRAAGAAGVVHVVDCISFSASSSAAVAATDLSIVVLDGATTLWTYAIGVPAIAGIGTQAVAPAHICGLNLSGTAATSMTLQWSAGLTGLIESVSMSGYDVQ